MAPQEEIYRSDSPDQTLELGRQLAARFRQGDCVALVGPLGAGKTLLVRGLVEGLGLEDRRLVSSPTFVLVQEYPARIKVFHVDLYRLIQPEPELAGLGLEEMLAEGVVLVEWAERAQAALPCPHWRVEIAIIGPTSRQFRLRRVP
jgi:tRNA threonylcarbamoyladenosine biosynthesis protein TsaE